MILPQHITLSILNPITSTPETDIVLDACTSWTPRYESELPMAPTEKGDSIGDHVILKPLGISFSAIVSDTPVDALDPIAGAFQRVHVVRTALIDARENRRPLQVFADDEFFDSMFIETMEFPHTLETSGSLPLTLTLRRIRTVSAQTVRVARVKKGTGHKVGKRDKTAATDDALTVVTGGTGSQYVWREDKGIWIKVTAP